MKYAKNSNVKKKIFGIAILLICLVLALIGYKLVRYYINKGTETEKVVDTRLKKMLDKHEDIRDVTVAVIDSGINMQDEWDDRVVSGDYNYTNDEDMSDSFYHGTVLSKIILEETDNRVRVLPIKVADSQGSVNASNVIRGIDCAIENKVDIINISLNMMISDESKSLEDEITKATDSGIKVVVSAGNNKTDVDKLSPSDMENVYVVSSIENDNTFSYYSNFGKEVDVCAYGTYDSYTGTSYAAARVSAVFAQLLEKDITDIDGVINNYTESVGTKEEDDKDQKYGHGYFGTTMYTASANLHKEDATNVCNLGYNLMSLDWRSLDTDTLDQYLAGTKPEYVGLFLKSLSETDIRELEEKSNVIHTQISKQNFQRVEDEGTTGVALEYEPTDSEQIDYADYCINAFEKQKKELNLSSSIDAYAVGTTNTSEFYISDGPSHLICKYDISGFYNTIQNNSGQFGRNKVNPGELTIYGMEVKNDGQSELSIPTIIGNTRIRLYASSVQAHEVRWFNYNTWQEYDQMHEYHPEYIQSGSDNGQIYYGLSIDLQNFRYNYGFHTSENDLTVYKAGTDQPALSYNHIYDTNWNYNGSYYGDNCARMPIQTNFKTGVLYRTELFYNGNDKIMDLYRLSDTTSINPTSNEIQLNGPLMYLPGTEWKDGSNWTLAMNNDVASYVFNTVPNKYTFRYETAWGTGNGTMPEDVIHYTDEVKLRQPDTFKYSGHTFDHYSVRRESDNAIYCTDKQWHPYDEVKDQYKFWKWYYPGETECCNADWTRSNYNTDDTFTFCAIWRPLNYNITYNAGGGKGNITPEQVNFEAPFTLKEGFTGNGQDFDGYYVTRKSDNKVFTTRGTWENKSSVAEKDRRKYRPGYSDYMNLAWVRSDYYKDDTYIFTATWKASAKVSLTVNHYVMDADGKYVLNKTYSPEIRRVDNGKTIVASLLVNKKIIVPNGIYFARAEVNGIKVTKITPTSNMTINLYYDRKQYNVNYDVASNGGTWQDGKITNKTVGVRYGAKVDLTTYKGSKNSWNFIGWNKEKDSEIALNNVTMGTCDITLYAIYNKTLTATFIDAVGTRKFSVTIYNNSTRGTVSVPEERDCTWENVQDVSNVGWNSSPTEHTNELTSSEIDLIKDCTYYGIYSATAKISYDCTEGSDIVIAPYEITVYKNAANMDKSIREKIKLPAAVEHTKDKPGYIDKYVQVSWAENSVEGKQYIPSTEYDLTQNTTMYAIWKGEYEAISYTIRFNANGGTGTMPDMTAHYDQAQDLPKCNFERSNEGGKSTFLGWSKTQDAKDPEYSDQETVINLTKKDQDIITFYAIWDDCPILSADDMYYTVKDAQNGKITEELLLTTSKAIDDRDLDIKEKVKVRDYNPNEWKQFTTDGSSVVTLTVQDASGNKTKCTFTVHLVDTTAKTDDDTKYVRSINEKYYDKPADQGGLDDNSIWRINPEYATVLQAAMNNRRSLVEEQATTNIFGKDYKATKAGSVSRNHTYQTWVFSSADIQEVKNYVNEHGIGNSKEPTALQGFLQQFNRCKQ